MKTFLFFFFLLTPALIFSSPLKKNGQPNRYYPKPAKKIIPIVMPQKEKEQQVIILDPGHGGTDEGAKVQTLMEKKLSLMTSLFTKKYLREMGYRIILTRSRDITLPLQKRVAIANQAKGDLFVSIHYNSAKSKEAKGIEIFYFNAGEPWRSQASKRLAQNILHEIIGNTHAISRGIKIGNHHVTRETSVPAVLVEGGFITNGEERSLLRDPTYLEKIARGIAVGIDKYLASI